MIEEYGASPDVVFSSRFVAHHADGTEVAYRLPVFTEDDVYSEGTTATLQLLPSLAAGSIDLAIFSLAGKPATCMVGVFDENGADRATSALALPPGPVACRAHGGADRDRHFLPPRVLRRPILHLRHPFRQRGPGVRLAG